MSIGGKSDDFKYTSRIRVVNLCLQIILGITLFLGLNYMSARHYKRWDLSENSKNSLSLDSKAYVENLKAPVEIIAIISQGINDRDSAAISKDLRSIFKQYAYVSKKTSPITYDFIDPYIENKKIEALATRFGSDLANCVIVASGDKFKKIPILDFYKDTSSERGFMAEPLLTSAILHVTSAKETQIYFLKMHGELDFKSTDKSRGLSEFSNELRRNNYNLKDLDLTTLNEVPKDCDLLIIAGVRNPLKRNEIEAIKNYLRKSNGRVAIFLDMGPLFGLEEIMSEWGMMSNDMLVVDSSGDYESSSGDLIAKGFPEKSPHPISKYLMEAFVPVQFGSVRPVSENLWTPQDDTLKLSAIILSGNTSWAEKSYSEKGKQNYDMSIDIKGPIPLAMAASRTGGSKFGLKIEGGKLVVFGDENFITNNSFNRLGNKKLAQNTIYWLLEEDNMLNIPPRPMNNYSLTMSRSDVYSLAGRFMGLALIILAMGIVVAFMRRR